MAGLKLLREAPHLRKWAIMPFAIDLLLLVVFVIWGIGHLSIWVASALGWIFSGSAGFLYSVLYYPLYVLLGLGFVVVTLYGVFLISTVVAAPFNSILAEKVLSYRGVIPDHKFSFGRWIKVSIKMMLSGILKGLLFGLLGLIIFVCSYIPGLNIAASFAAFIIIVFDSMDYSFEAMEIGLREQIKHFRKHFLEYSGMASSMGLTLLLPGLTLLVLPLSVIGAAAMLADSKDRF